MPRTLAALGLLAALLLPAPAQADETQAWETNTTHLHAVFGMTMFQTVSATTTVPFTVLLHNSHARVYRVRWSCESDVKQNVDVAWQGTGAAEQKFGPVNLTVDPGLCSAGWRELRFTAIARRTNGEQEFTTSRECVNFTRGNGTSSNYCGGPTIAGRCGGGAWYQATGYLVPTVDCRDVARAAGAGFHPGDVIRVRTQIGGGSIIGTFDPSFHTGNQGVGLQTKPAGSTYQSFVIPNLPAGLHKFHVRHTLGGFSGAFVLSLRIV